MQVQSERSRGRRCELPQAMSAGWPMGELTARGGGGEGDAHSNDSDSWRHFDEEIQAEDGGADKLPRGGPQ